MDSVMTELVSAIASGSVDDGGDPSVCQGDGTTCTECGKVFSHPFYFSTHISIHTSEKMFQVVGQCALCGMVFSNTDVFSAHLSSSQSKMETQMMPSEEFSSFDPDNVSSLTAACVQFEQSGPVHETPAPSKKRKSNKSMTIKIPPISASNDAAMGTPVTPSNDMGESRYKRKRKAPEKYMPDSRPQSAPRTPTSDVDPAVEAYLNSLSAMGLTVDPMAFGNSSAKKGRKTGGKVKGSNRRSSFGLDLDPSELFGIDVPQPKKPSPKYEYIDADALLEEDIEIIPKSGKNTRAQRLQQRLERLSQSGEKKRKVIDGEWEWYDKVAVKSETADKHVHHKMSSPRGGHGSKTKTASSPHSGNIHKIAKASTASHQYSLLITSPKMNKSPGLASSEPGNEKLRVSLSASRKSGTDLKFLGSTAVQKTPSLPGSIHNQTQKRNLLDMHQNVSHQKVQPSSRFQVYKRQGQGRPSVNCPPYEKNRTPRSPFTSHTRPLGHNTSNNPQGSVGVDSSKQTSRDYVEHMLQSVGVIAASSLPEQKRFSEDKGKKQRSNMGRNVQSHSRARGLWSDKSVNLPQGVNPFDTYFYKGRLKYWSKPFDSPGEDCSTPKEGYYRDKNPFAQRGGQHSGQVSSTSQANAVARNGPIIEKGSVRGSYHAVAPNRGRGGVTLPRIQPPPKPFLKTDEVIVIDDDDEDIGGVISIEKDTSSKQLEVEAQASTSEILDEDETGVRIMDVDKEQEQSKNIQSIMDKKKQLSPCVVLQRNMSQERLVAHRTRCEEDNESDANGNESEENTSENNKKNEKSDDNKNEDIEDGTENDENETGDDDDMKEGEEIDGWKVCLAENSDSESEEGNPAEICQNTASDGGSFSTSSHNPDSDCSINKNARIPDSSTKPQTHPSNHDLKDSEEDQSHSLVEDETLFSTFKEIDHTASTKRPKEEQSLPCDSQQNDQSRPKSTKIEDKDQSHGKNSPEMDGQSPSFGSQLQTWSPLNYSPVLDPSPSYSQDEVPSAKKMSKSKSSNDDSSGLGMLKQLKENDKSLPSQSDSQHRKPEKKMCADAKVESEVSCSLSHSDDKTDDLEKPSSSQTSSFSKASNDYMSEGSNLLDIFSEIEKTCKEMEENSGNEWEESENTMDVKDENGESENLLSEVLNKIGAVDEVNQGQRKGTSNMGQEKEGKEGEEQMNSRNKEDNSEIAAKNGEGKEIVDQENKEQLNLSDERDISGTVGKENRNREKVGVDQEDQENVGNDNEGQRKAENDNEVHEIHVVESDNEDQEKVENNSKDQEKVEHDSEDQEKVAVNVGDDQEMMEVESESENIDSILKNKIKVNENIDEREANDKKSGGDDKSGENNSGIVSMKELQDETKERYEEMDDIVNTKVDCMTEMERNEIEEVDGNDFALMIEGKNEKTADEIDMSNEIGCTNKMEEVVNKEKECSEEINEAEKILTAEGMGNDNEKEEADEVERIEGGMMDKSEVRKTKGEVEGEMEIDMKERDEEDEVKTELENIDKNMVSDVTSDVKKGDENENGDGRMYEREEERQVQEGNKSDPKLKLENDDDDKTRETDEADGMKGEKESTRRKEIDNEVMKDKDVCGRGGRDKDMGEGCGSLSTHRGEAHSNNADHKHSVSDGAGKMENSSGTKHEFSSRNFLSSSEKEEGKEQKENIDGTLESELNTAEIATNVGSCKRDVANNSSEEDEHGVLASNFRTAHKAVKNIDATKNLTKESTLNYDVEFKATENMDVTQNLPRESDSKDNVDSCISEDKCNIDNEGGSASQKQKSRSSCKDEEKEDVGDHNDGGDDDDDNHCDGSNGTSGKGAGRGVQTTSNRYIHKGASGNGKMDSTTSNSGGNSGSSQNSILTMVLAILCQRTPSPLYLCHPGTCNTFGVSINMNYCMPLCDQNTCPSL